MKENIVIWDMDGTLTEQPKHVKGSESDINNAIRATLLRPTSKDLVQSYNGEPYKHFIVTGRKEISLGSHTRQQIMELFEGMVIEELYMYPTDMKYNVGYPEWKFDNIMKRSQSGKTTIYEDNQNMIMAEVPSAEMYDMGGFMKILI